MQVKYKAHKENPEEEGTCTIGDTITVTLDCISSNYYSSSDSTWCTTLPDGTEITIG